MTTRVVIVPEEEPAPVSAPRMPAPARTSSLSDPLIQVKAGVHSPPEMTAQVVAAVETLRTAHRLAGAPLVTITDWYRTATENLALPGSSPNSLHLRGLAFDLRNDPAGLAVFRAWLSLGFDGLDERVRANHLHVEYQRRG